MALFAEEQADLYTVHRIKSEAFENSKVMEHAWYLTDVSGPRMTNTPGFQKAAAWVISRMKEYGIPAKLEKWGPYGRGWSYSRFSAHMIEPSYQPLIGFPLAWSASTNGVAMGEPMLAVMRTEADFEKFRGKLRDKIVLTDSTRELAMQNAPAGKRFSDTELAEMGIGVVSGPATPARAEQTRKFREKLRQFLIDQGVSLAVQIGRGEGGTVFGQSASTREKKDPVAVPGIVLTPEHYNRIARLIERKIPVELEVETRTQMHEDTAESTNVVAEIPGVRKKEEIVMLGAHLDSWHSGTGATDNAAGCAVAMEAMRILKTLDLRMDRTVRLALWSGEENGLLGSKAYVKNHFADPETMALKPEHGKISGYFNLDNGTGRIRGIYLQNSDMHRPIFEAWLKPFRDIGATAVVIRKTGSTDHVSFDAVGIPGFEFIQDPIEYSTRTHHSNMDVYDRLQRPDLMQAAAVMASFVYHAANREEMLPRKPLPKPQPKKEDAKPEEKKVLSSAGE